MLDSSKCISYLTIEHRGEIPEAFRDRIGAHVYGCDICQEVCPYNGAAPTSTDLAWLPRQMWDRPALTDLARMPDAELAEGLRGSAMSRAKPAGLRRNVSIALKNTQRSDPALSS